MRGLFVSYMYTPALSHLTLACYSVSLPVRRSGTARAAARIT